MSLLFSILNNANLPSTNRSARSRGFLRIQGIEVFILLVLSGTTLFLWQALRAQERVAWQRAADNVAADLRNEIIEHITADTHALARMAARWETAGKPPRAYWEADARGYVQDSPEYQAVEWVDASFHCRWVVPLKGNEAVLHFNLTKEKRRSKALLTARDQHRIVISRPIHLVQGGEGFLIYVPIFHAGHFEGLIVGVYRFAGLLAALPNHASANADLTIGEGGKTIYRQSQAISPHQGQWSQRVDVPLLTTTWTLSVLSEETARASYRSPLPFLVLATGLLLTLLIGILFRCTQRARLAQRRLTAEVYRRTDVECRLRHANAQKKTILESITDAFLTLDTDWRFTYLNSEAERHIGRPSEELIGKNVWDEFPHAVGTAWEIEYRRALTTNTAVTFEIFNPERGLWTEVRAYPSVEGLTVYFQNVTERKAAEDRLRASEERFQAFMDNSPNIAWITDADGIIEYVNQPYCQMIGLMPDALRGKSVFDVYPEPYAQVLLDNIRAVALTRQAQEVTETVPDDNQALRHFLVHKFPLGEIGGRLLIGGAATEITARIQAEQRLNAANEWLEDANAHLQDLNVELETRIQQIHEQAAELEAKRADLVVTNWQLMEANLRLEELATRDGLTGLKNHRIFQERLQEEFARDLRYHAPLSLILLDVDYFKQYNDTYGHPAGDTVLKTLAQILQQQARGSDMVARYGGEEFALLLPNTEVEGARQLAERLRRTVAEQNWPERPITISLGVATMHPLMREAGTLVEDADRALYHSKHSGRNRVSHVEDLPETSAQKPEELVLTAEELHRAYDATIEGWSRILDLRDKETEGHSVRVTELTLHLARKMGMQDEELIYIRWGALLHDIGKMGVPDHILLKPGPLSPDEWTVMQKHPTLAYDMLSMIGFLLPALDIPRYHHEKWDGSGYPYGLKGEQIPLAARLFAIVDVWDALCNDRPYRAAWSQEKARSYIQEQSGTHFDPHVVKTFLSVVSELPGRANATPY